MEQYLLYLYFRDMIKNIDPSYQVSFNDMDDNGKNVIGIYIKGGSPSVYRKLSSGAYVNKNVRVQMLGHSEDNFSHLLNMLSLFTQIESIIPSLFDVKYISPTGIKRSRDDLRYNIYIINCEIMNGTSYLGKTEQNVPVIDINFTVNYSLLDDITDDVDDITDDVDDITDDV